MTTSFKESDEKRLFFDPFFNWVKSGKIDGFFVSHDNASYVTKNPLVEKLNLTAYNAPSGFLYFKSNRFSRYGYETVEDFIHDCNAGLLQCKTAAGALTLGPTRNLKGTISYVYLYGSGLPSALLFYSESPEQSKALHTTLLEGYPGATIRILQSKSLSSLQRFQPILKWEYWRILLFESTPRVRSWFRIFIGTVILTMLCLLFNLLGYLSELPSWIGMGCFIISFIVFTICSQELGYSLAPQFEGAPVTSLEKEVVKKTKKITPISKKKPE